MHAIFLLSSLSSLLLKYVRAPSLIIRSFSSRVVGALTAISLLLAFTLSATAVEPQPGLNSKTKTPEHTDMKDRDLDGVPDMRDNYPSIPNKPMKNGKQSLAPIRRPLTAMSS